ncbi:TPA: DUF551 domain-containing protein [Citrobacter braakii]|nr:DUF551 domain-containing protein [Citrobacter braakii]
MITITKEFTKEQLQQIIETDHVQCGEASSLARTALASLEAEPVAWAHRLINKRNGVVHPWVYGSAEACPSEGDIFNIEVMPLYTVPPAPVSVPAAMEMDDDFDSAFEHGKAVGWNAYRAAMLQGAEPVTTAYKLRYAVETIRNSGIEINAEKIFAERDALNSPVIPDGWVACSERMPETMVSVLVTGTWFHHSVAFWDGLSWCDLDFEQPVTHWIPLPAAPQQEA